MKKRLVGAIASALLAASLLTALSGCDEIVEEAVNAAGQAAMDEITRVAEDALGVPLQEIGEIVQGIENLGEYEWGEGYGEYEGEDGWAAED